MKRIADQPLLNRIGDQVNGSNGMSPVNTALLSVQAKSSDNCDFPMPFAKSARVEFEAGPNGQANCCQVLVPRSESHELLS